MEELARKASLRDAGTTAGIATDKLLALTGQTPPAVGVVIMPSETERAEQRAIDAKLDAIAGRLAINPRPTNLQSGEENCKIAFSGCSGVSGT